MRVTKEQRTKLDNLCLHATGYKSSTKWQKWCDKNGMLLDKVEETLLTLIKERATALRTQADALDKVVRGDTENVSESQTPSAS